MNILPLSKEQIRILRMLRRERERARRQKEWSRMFAAEGILDAYERRMAR